MSFNLSACSSDNGLWKSVRHQWRQQCEDFDADSESYAQSAMGVLTELAEEPTRRAKVYVLRDENGIAHCVFQANSTALPHFDGLVLRIRHMILSPDYDYGQKNVTEYAQILTESFSHACALASTDMPSAHVKFHFRTPADLDFFRRARPTLQQDPAFTSVMMYGAWLALSLK
ncbi:hypothetical protein [Gluconobacter kondonii]|uniref:hypothetical protein n=1 Tax=Gluconobacter kondonii TaxID=941463 RepID=UPI001B8B879A|nr:hypothetical protein [Gluconobacter kondonii]MBS1080822.1 hypothetical protein [Gluconobacter kondonii]